MRKIDIHTHILPRDLPDLKSRYGYGGFVALRPSPASGDKALLVHDDGTLFREILSNCWDPKRRLEEMDQAGVQTQVLSTLPVLFSYWAKPEHGLDLSRLLNDHIAKVLRDHPRRFLGLGTLPMQSAELAVQELERCARELGLAGVQIGSNVEGANLDDPRLMPVFAAAQDLGAAVFVHPWQMLAPERMRRHWTPWLIGMPSETALAIASMVLGGVLKKLPRLRIAFAHGGGSYAALAGRVERGFAARPELCAVDIKENPSSYLGRFYVDSVVHDPRVLSLLLEVFGEERVCLGSDYPFPLGEAVPGRLVESTGLSPKAKERILRLNALAWLGQGAREAAHAL